MIDLQMLKNKKLIKKVKFTKLKNLRQKWCSGSFVFAMGISNGTVGIIWLSLSERLVVEKEKSKVPRQFGFGEWQKLSQLRVVLNGTV